MIGIVLRLAVLFAFGLGLVKLWSWSWSGGSFDWQLYGLDVTAHEADCEC